jgi:hypothetical protein
MAQNWAYGSQSSVDHSSGGGNSWVISKPAGTVDGDLLVGFFSYLNAATLTLPSGWAHVTGSPAIVIVTAKYAFVWKIASSEPASWTFSTSGSNLGFVGLVVRYTGILAAPAPVAGLATSTTSSVTAPAVTTLTADSLVIRAAFGDNATTLSFASGTSRALVGGSGDLIRVVDQDQVTVAATPTDVATANTANNMAAFTVAFKQTTVSGTHVVSGAGSFAVASPVGMSASYTGIPTSLGQGRGNPVRYFELGNVAWGTANGPTRNYYLEHNPELIVAPFAGATIFYYSLAPGVTATFQELVAL